MATYYVSNSSGNDENTGLIGFPWKTLSKVSSVSFSPGDMILFNKGETWTGYLSITSSGSSGSIIIFAYYGSGADPIFDGTGESKTIVINDAEYIALSGIEVTNGDHCIFIETSTKTGLITLDHMTAHDAVNGNCVTVNGRNYVTINNGEFYDASGSGIKVSGSNINIMKNFVHGNEEHGISIVNNTAVNFTSNGIYYNIIKGSISGNYGINLSGTGPGVSYATFINNNTIYGESGLIGLGLFNGSSLKQKNNIVITTGISIKTSVSVAELSRSDNNCFHSDIAFHMHDPVSDTGITLLQWQNSGEDLHSIEEDPMFVSASPTVPTDFALNARSLCINAGDSEFAVVTTDYSGTRIYGRPNIGALESSFADKKQSRVDRFSRLDTLCGVKTKTIRDIVDTNYNNLLIGATIGSNVLGNPLGNLFDQEFSYATPENDFKHATVRAVHGAWDWTDADPWVAHVVAENQTLRVHGPIGPQCSTWAMDDFRTGSELEAELLLWMETLCTRYNSETGFDYLDVVNETLIDGEWHGPKRGTWSWQNPWTLIGFDTDTNSTPLYIRKAFQTAQTYAPNMKFIFNHHEAPQYTASWDIIKETVLYLRDLGLRVDGIGWQAHVNAGSEVVFSDTIPLLKQLIEWAHTNALEFHITEFSAWLYGNTTSNKNRIAQAKTYRSIIRALLEMRYSGVVAWNTWHVVDSYGWFPERKAALFDEIGTPKKAYFALSNELELHRDK